MENEIKVERKLTSLEKRFKFKKPARYKETILSFTNYFEFGGKENE